MNHYPTNPNNKPLWENIDTRALMSDHDYQLLSDSEKERFQIYRSYLEDAAKRDGIQYVGCYFWLRDIITKLIKNPDFDNFETVKKDGWCRVSLVQLFKSDVIEDQLEKLKKEFNVDLIWSTSTSSLGIKKLPQTKMNKEEALERLSALEHEAQQLRNIINEPDAQPEVSKQQRLWDIIDASIIRINKQKYPDSIHGFHVDGYCLWFYNLKRKELYVSHPAFFSKIENEFGFDYQQIYDFIINEAEQFLGCTGIKLFVADPICM